VLVLVLVLLLLLVVMMRLPWKNGEADGPGFLKLLGLDQDEPAGP